jgi:V8-like Glu-specific endopeptidase
LLKIADKFLSIIFVGSNMLRKGSRKKRKINRLRFFGQRDRPLHIDEIVSRNPILARKNAPQDFVALNHQHRTYIYTENEMKKPRIVVHKLEKNQRVLWQVELQNLGDYEIDVRYAKTSSRDTADVILKGVPSNPDFNGFRPEWADLFYIPRFIPEYYRPLRRLNGRLVKPLWRFDPEDRKPYKDSSYPWRCIGKIFNSNGKQGTGALVGKNFVVTAGHMVPWGSSSWWMKFVPSYFDGNSLLGKDVYSFVSNAKGYNPSGDVCGYDWAILRLYHDLGTSLGYIGYNSYSDDWEDEPYWTLVGYPAEVAGGEKPSYQSAVSIIDDDSDSNGGRELETYADTTGGNSGGPLMGMWDHDVRLVGVVSGGETEYEFPFSSEGVNVIAGGSGLYNLIAWGRSNW